MLGGPDGRAKVLALYVASIGYARHFLTDGFVPDAWLSTNGVVTPVSEIAKVFCHKRVRLFHRRRGGYLIHDFEKMNAKASDMKEKREKVRLRVAAWRARQNGEVRES
jgi:hypothetical protein